jgi:hypothetical protein
VGIFDRLFGSKPATPAPAPAAPAPAAPARARYPKKIEGGEDVESLEITGVEGNTVALVLKFDKKNLKPQPAPNTDIVFVVDASGCMHDLYRTGAIQDAVWNILSYVLEYDDDGIDFFLHSAATDDTDRINRLLPRIRAGQGTQDEIRSLVRVRSLGQIADRKQLDAALNLRDSEFGMGTVCAPAFAAAEAKRKPEGNLFIELVTDGAFMDRDDVIRQIVGMSKKAHSSKKYNMFRVHILGIGAQVDERFLHQLDEGLSNVAPLDIVAYDLARDVKDSPGLIFKELEKGFMTVGNNGTVEIKGAKPTKITNAYNGVSDPEMLVLERVPQTLELEVEFPSLPTSFTLDITFSDTDGDDFQVRSTVTL